MAGLDPAVDVRPEYVEVPEHPGNKVIAIHFGGWVWGRLPYSFHGCPYYKVESTTKYDNRIEIENPGNKCQNHNGV